MTVQCDNRKSLDMCVFLGVWGPTTSREHHRSYIPIFNVIVLLDAVIIVIAYIQISLLFHHVSHHGSGSYPLVSMGVC